MFNQLKSGIGFVGPRTMAHLSKSVGELRADLKATREALKQARDIATATAQAHATTARQLEEVTSELRAVKTQVAAVQLREAQLRAIAKADAALAGSEEALAATLSDPGLASHVAAAISGARFQNTPFPYCVVKNLLPKPMYEALLTGLPPVELFGDRPFNKQQLTVPVDVAPAYSRRVWRFMAETMCEEMIQAPVLELFRAPVNEWLRHNFPGTGDNPLDRVAMHCSDGRILRRGRGYRIQPHRDPKWGFITGIIYLARPGDDQRWGTQLYAVDDDQEARGAAPHWIDPSRCRPVEHVPFKKNTALFFLNSYGAHGASIPEDAEPADLDRHVFQFRIGPTAAAIASLISGLPAERRAAWAGKITSY